MPSTDQSIHGCITEHQRLFDKLNALVESNHLFYKKVIPRKRGLAAVEFHLFDYYAADYKAFQDPDVRECRGITFEVSPDSLPVIISRPLKKFFNLGEFPGQKPPLAWDIRFRRTKHDGTMVSTWYSPGLGTYGFKTKMSFTAPQLDPVKIPQAWKFIEYREWHNLMNEVEELGYRGYTLIFEAVSPIYRIVLEYHETDVKFIAIRNNTTGEMLMNEEEVKAHLPDLVLMQKFAAMAEESDLGTADQIQAATGVEGEVWTMIDGTMLKVKADEYCNLHPYRTITVSKKQIFKDTLDGVIDDYLPKIKDRPEYYQYVLETRNKTTAMFEAVVSDTIRKAGLAAGLSKKEAALKILAMEDSLKTNNLALTLLGGSTPDYKFHANNHRVDLYGISDLDPDTMKGF